MGYTPEDNNSKIANEIAVFHILRRWGLEDRPELAAAIRGIGDYVENRRLDRLEKAIESLQKELENATAVKPEDGAVENPTD